MERRSNIAARKESSFRGGGSGARKSKKNKMGRRSKSAAEKESSSRGGGSEV